MGYRASIKNINAIGHLIEGNVYTFLEQATLNDEMKHTTIEFLDRLIRNTSDRFYMSKKYWRGLRPELENLREDWYLIRNEFNRIEPRDSRYREDNKYDKYLSRSNKLLNYLKSISKIFPDFSSLPIVDSRRLHLRFNIFYDFVVSCFHKNKKYISLYCMIIKSDLIKS